MRSLGETPWFGFVGSDMGEGGNTNRNDNCYQRKDSPVWDEPEAAAGSVFRGG